MSSFWLLAVVCLAVSPGGHADLAGTLKTDGGVVTRCTGSNVTLLEAPPGVTPFHVYVIRGRETIATTSVKAQGLMQDRLFVRGDGSVLLTNLTSDDLGKYRLEVKVTEADSNPPKHVIRLVVAEPPRTFDGKLFVQQEPRDGTYVRVKCGVFDSLGHPPVFAKWRDPSGQFLASQGFEDGFFYLDLPLTTSLSGTYCCQLHCPEPDHCCLQEASALRRCAEVDVTTNKSPDSGCDVTDSTRNDLRALEQRVWALTDRLQSLQDGQAREGACSQNLGSAMAQLMNLQVKDQLEAHWARLKEWEAEQADLDKRDNQSHVAALSDCDKRELQQRLDDQETRFQQRLSDVAQQVADNHIDMQQSVEDLRQLRALQVSDLEGRLKQTLGDLERTLRADIASLNQSMGDLEDTLRADMASLNQSMGDLEDTLRADMASLNQSMEDNQSRVAALSDTNKRQLQQRLNELQGLFEQRLSDIAQQIADNHTDMLESVANCRQEGAALEARLNKTMGDLKDTLHLKPELGLISCRDLLAHANKSGVYTLRPDGVNTYPVHCDLTTDGGGWLVFQRRQDGSVNFSRDWADYEEGFGDLSSEFWLGLKKLHAITSSRRHRLRVDLMDHQGERKYAVYDNFRVESASENYRLTVSGYSGTAGDSLGDSTLLDWNGIHNGMSFSTRDRDNDNNSGSCAHLWKVGWWYNSCHFSSLNGLYKASGAAGWDGITWYSFRRDERSLTFAEMKIQPV